MTESTLWERYRARDDQGAREALLEQHLPLVRYVARGVWKRIHGKLEMDDLVSAGTLGLIESIDNFDPDRGLAFSTFATPRIRGAMLDQLRQWDHVPRSVRRKQRALDTAREELTSRLSREPTSAEVAHELDLDVETLGRWEADTSDAVRVALDAPLPGEGRTLTSADIIPGDDGAEFEDDLNRNEEVALLMAEIAELPERERTILSLYYFEELKMHQIAALLGVTESRISQIRSKIIKGLRSRMGHLRESA